VTPDDLRSQGESVEAAGQDDIGHQEVDPVGIPVDDPQRVVPLARVEYHPPALLQVAPDQLP
jgi:hypothetical protein